MGTGVVTWATDPKAKTITVYYTESSTIYEGMPVCYEFDATTNWCGVSSIDATSTASSITESSTTTESNANEGKFIRVEDPDADNIHAFAGVVAGAGLAGKTGPCAIDIYIPNGAIVPVRTDQSCTVGRTILSVHTAEQHLTGCYETSGRPVALAWETDTDLASTTGTVLAKLDPNLFIWQKADNDAMLVDDQDSGNTGFLNQIKVEFANTSGNTCAFSVQAESTAGATSNGYGLALYAQADVTATVADGVNAFGAWINLTGGTPAAHVYAAEIGIYESGANLASATVVAPLCLRTQLDSTNAPNAVHFMMNFICDGTGDHPDGWFHCNEIQDIAMTAASSVTVDSKIAFKVGATTYYIPCGQTAG